MSEVPWVALGELVAEDPGAIAIGPFGSRMKSEVYVSQGVPVIRGTNISTSRSLKGDWVYVAEDFAKSMPNCIVREGDLVFPHRGAIGEVALLSARDGQMMLSTSMMKYRPDARRVSSAYLYYFFRSSVGRAEILKYASQVGTPGIGQPLTSLRQFRVPLPAMPIQEKIASILSSLDDKIELNRSMNLTLGEISHAIFKAWFVDFHPVKAKLDGAGSFTGMPNAAFDQLPDRLDQSPVGLIPSGWQFAPLSEFVKLLSGGTPKRKVPEYWNGTIPWFSVRDAPSDGDIWVTDTEEKITELGSMNSAAKVMRAGTTIISARGTVGRLALTAVPMAMNQSCYGAEGRGGLGDYFVYFLFQDAVMDLRQRTHGSVFDTITRETFATLTRVRPQSELAGAFEAVVKPYMELVRSNCFESRSLTAIRDGLFPRLVSGEISVPVPEA